MVFPIKNTEHFFQNQMIVNVNIQQWFILNSMHFFLYDIHRFQASCVAIIMGLNIVNHSTLLLKYEKIIACCTVLHRDRDTNALLTMLEFDYSACLFT